MTADPTHRHDQFHRGMVPDDQLADGTPADGDVPISNGDGTRTWGPMTGGGSDECSHQHVTDTFTAEGGSPETFTLTLTPLGDRRAYLNGLRVTPSAVGGTGTSVELETEEADEVIVDYEAACGDTPSGPIDLAYPGEEMELGGSPQNVLATIEATGPCAVVLTLTVGETSGGAFVETMSVINATDTYPSLYQDGWFLPDQNVLLADDPGVYLFRIPEAGTYYIVGSYGNGSYVADLAGEGTYIVVYPSADTTPLSFPGTSDVIVQNRLASVTTPSQSIIFMTIDDDLPSDYYLGTYGSTTGDRYLFSSGAPFPAGTYVYVCDDADASLKLYAYFDGDYDAGLTNTGTYEVVTP